MPRTASKSVTSLPALALIRERYVLEGRPLPRDLERSLRADPRAGAGAILAAVERRRRDNRAEGQRLRRMTRYERALWDQGCLRIAGVDEAGMSPLAGPVVAAAVVLVPGTRLAGVDDSKKLGPAQRDALAATIRERALGVGVGTVDPPDIDRLNIYHAGLLAMRRAVLALPLSPDYLLVDARTVALDVPQQGIVKGDQQSLSIAAASIIAKTTRDAHMVALDGRHPQYGFARHKGYPVKAHVEALMRLGPTPHHRRSFALVRLSARSDSRRSG